MTWNILYPDIVDGVHYNIDTKRIFNEKYVVWTMSTEWTFEHCAQEKKARENDDSIE